MFTKVIRIIRSSLFCESEKGNVKIPFTDSKDSSELRAVCWDE